MTIQNIETNLRYSFDRLIGLEKIKSTVASFLQTMYIHKGTAMLEFQPKEGQLERHALKAGEGFVVIPGTIYNLESNPDFEAFRASSKVGKKPIVEIIDDGKKQREIPIGSYKIIQNLKRVEKPWGYELWILWTKYHHVLKQIGMTARNQCSLQFHRVKLETNYLTEGKADVIEGYRLDPQAPEEEVQASSQGVDFDQYRKHFEVGDSWTSVPGMVHRVISMSDYIAYEVSTPELDDCIRLQDDTGRTSGRIVSEHLKGGKE